MPRKARAKPVGSGAKGRCGLDEQLVESAYNLDLVELLQLLEQGASVTFSRETKGPGWSGTALHAVLKTSGASLERRLRGRVITALLRARADVNAQCTWGEGQRYSASAFDMAVNGLVSGQGQRDMSMVREMLLQNADPNSMSRAPILCAEASKLKARDKFVTQTYSMETTSPLHRATRAGDHECVHVLLSAGASVNAQRTEKGTWSQDKTETALHIASELGDVSMVSLLLEHGADVNAVRKRLKHRVRGLEYDLGGSYADVESGRIEETALHIAIGIGPKNLLMVRTLVDAAADVSIPRISGERRTSTTSLCKQFQDVSLLNALESQRKVISINSHDLGSDSLKLNLSSLDGSSFEIELPSESVLADLVPHLKTYGYDNCHVIGPSGSLWTRHLWHRDLCGLLCMGQCTARERAAGAVVCAEGAASASDECGFKARLETGISLDPDPIKTYVQRRVFSCLTAR